MLFVPATRHGQIIANHEACGHKVLGERYLKEAIDFDKVTLRKKFPSLGGFLMPCYDTPDEVVAFPTRAKPRSGQGSLGQFDVHSRAQLRSLPNAGEYYFEPILPVGCDEYSLTVVRSPSGKSGMCIKRLSQHEGVTVRASSVIPEEIRKISERITASVECDSIINLQFAAMGGGIRIYDINPRFGHSEIFRMCFGFNFIAEFCDEHSRVLTDRLELSLEEAHEIVVRHIREKQHAGS